MFPSVLKKKKKTLSSYGQLYWHTPFLIGDPPPPSLQLRNIFKKLAFFFQGKSIGANTRSQVTESGVPNPFLSFSQRVVPPAMSFVYPDVFILVWLDAPGGLNLLTRIPAKKELGKCQLKMFQHFYDPPPGLRRDSFRFYTFGKLSLNPFCGNECVLTLFIYWGFHKKGTFSYLCALGIDR